MPIVKNKEDKDRDSRLDEIKEESPLKNNPPAAA